MKHVAILAEDSRLRFGEMINVLHMGPPLVAGAETRSTIPDDKATCEAHVVGSTELSAEDREGMRTWLAEVDKEKRPARSSSSYTAIPPMEWITDSISGVRRYRRFSCVGFIVECYKSVEIVLLDIEAGDVPSVSIAIISDIYGDRLRLYPQLRGSIGLYGDGPWPALLPGYVLHALDRGDESIRESPHKPESSAEAHFP